MASPPFSSLAAFAAAVAEQVPDARAARSDSDLVLDALERYAEQRPCMETQDIGDGTTKAWSLTAAPFAYAAATSTLPPMGWVPGYSDQWPVLIEDLASAGVSQVPAQFRRFGKFGEDCDAWIEERTVSSLNVPHLVFESAPTTSLVRVHFRKRWSIPSSGSSPVTVPRHHHMAVVDLACALKCDVLAASYIDTVDSVAGSDVFSGTPKSDAYREMAKGFWAAYSRAIGIDSGAVPSMATGRIRTGRLRVFPRGVA